MNGRDQIVFNNIYAVLRTGKRLVLRMNMASGDIIWEESK